MLQDTLTALVTTPEDVPPASITVALPMRKTLLL